MKKSNIKLFSLLFAAFTMTATMVSCGNDDNKSNPETNNGDNSEVHINSVVSRSDLSVWGLIESVEAEDPMYDAQEKIEIIKGYISVNDSKVAYDSLYIYSPVMGTGKFDMNTKTGTMNILSANLQTFEARLSGSISEKQFVIQIPSYKGGTTITSHIGKDNIYTLNTYADNARNYFQPKSYATANEKMVIILNTNQETANIYFTSQSTPSWGTHVFTNISAVHQSDSYQISGEGSAIITSSRTGELNTYLVSINATFKDGKITGEISVPSVMGGITIHLNPEDFDTVINNGN